MPGPVEAWLAEAAVDAMSESNLNWKIEQRAIARLYEQATGHPLPELVPLTLPNGDKYAIEITGRLRFVERGKPTE